MVPPERVGSEVPVESTPVRLPLVVHIGLSAPVVLHVCLKLSQSRVDRLPQCTR